MKKTLLSLGLFLLFSGILSAQTVTLVVNFDNFPNEVGWKITNSSGTAVVQVTPGASNAFTSGSSRTFNYTLAAGNYTFFMIDTYGDGLQGTPVGKGVIQIVA